MDFNIWPLIFLFLKSIILNLYQMNTLGENVLIYKNFDNSIVWKPNNTINTPKDI